jgi:hypothetical protein
MRPDRFSYDPHSQVRRRDRIKWQSFRRAACKSYNDGGVSSTGKLQMLFGIAARFRSAAAAHAVVSWMPLISTVPPLATGAREFRNIGLVLSHKQVTAVIRPTAPLKIS